MSEGATASPERGRPLVLLGVTGGVAACKAPLVVRRLQDQGLQVRCLLTANAERFVAPLTLEVLSGAPVRREEYLDAGRTGGAELHIRDAGEAAAMCVAPATANTLSRLAYGIADDFLTTTALAIRAPLVLAPAMHSEMWAKPAVQQAVARLREAGARFVGPVSGSLASGESGLGRLAEPEAIADAVWSAITPQDLAGRRFLVTAGPTYEPIDPVRFLGNRSSGRMGFSLAAEAARRGAECTLVAGPVSLPTPPGVERIDVGTALEMEAAVKARAPHADVVIMAAAVADYRPRRIAGQKLKKQDGTPTVELVENPDILAGLAAVAPRAVRMGFAAETERLAENAARKLAAKRVDLLVANDVSRADIGFGSEHNEVTVWRPGEPAVRLERATKDVLAARLVDLVLGVLAVRSAEAVAPSGGRTS